MASVIRYQPSVEAPSGAVGDMGQVMGQAMQHVGQGLASSLDSAAHLARQLAIIQAQDAQTKTLGQQAAIDALAGEMHRDYKAATIRVGEEVRSGGLYTNIGEQYTAAYEDIDKNYLARAKDAGVDEQRFYHYTKSIREPHYAGIPEHAAALVVDGARKTVQTKITEFSQRVYEPLDSVKSLLNDISAYNERIVALGGMTREQHVSLVSKAAKDALAARDAFRLEHDPYGALSKRQEDIRGLTPYLGLDGLADLARATGDATAFRQETLRQFKNVLATDGASKPWKDYERLAKEAGLDLIEAKDLYAQVHEQDIERLNKHVDNVNKQEQQLSSERATILMRKWTESAYGGKTGTSALVSDMGADLEKQAHLLSDSDLVRVQAFHKSLLESRDTNVDDIPTYSRLVRAIDENPNNPALDSLIVRGALKGETKKALMNRVAQNREELKKEHKSQIHESVMKGLSFGEDLIQSIDGGQGGMSSVAKTRFTTTVLNALYRGEGKDATPESKALWLRLHAHPSNAVQIIKDLATSELRALEYQFQLHGKELFDKFRPDRPSAFEGTVAREKMKMMFDTTTIQGRENAAALNIYLQHMKLDEPTATRPPTVENHQQQEQLNIDDNPNFKILKPKK